MRRECQAQLGAHSFLLNMKGFLSQALQRRGAGPWLLKGGSRSSPRRGHWAGRTDGHSSAPMTQAGAELQRYLQPGTDAPLSCYLSFPVYVCLGALTACKAKLELTLPQS